MTNNLIGRRSFLASVGALFVPLSIIPVPAFVPPREPFVRMGRRGLDELVSQLGVAPTTSELSICEGVILKIEDWDGVGYPCLVQNACTFGANPPCVWL
jgi:hypothetical protein